MQKQSKSFNVENLVKRGQDHVVQSDIVGPVEPVPLEVEDRY